MTNGITKKANSNHPGKGILPCRGPRREAKRKRKNTGKIYTLQGSKNKLSSARSQRDQSSRHYSKPGELKRPKIKGEEITRGDRSWGRVSRETPETRHGTPGNGRVLLKVITGTGPVLQKRGHSRGGRRRTEHSSSRRKKVDRGAPRLGEQQGAR